MIATALVAVVGVSATTGLQLIQQRQAVARAQATMVNWAHEELTLIEAAGLRGSITAPYTLTRTRTGINGRVGTMTVQVTTSSEASNLFAVLITASYNDGQARSFTIRSAVFNRAIPRAVGVRFRHPSDAPASDAHYMGYFPTRNWNALTTNNSSGTTLIDNSGVNTTLVVYTSLSNISIFNNNLHRTGIEAVGENMDLLFGSGIYNSTSTPATYTLTLTNIPYSRYDLILYLNVPDTGTGQNGWARLASGVQLNAAIPPSPTSLPRQVFVEGSNFVIFRNQTSTGQTITIGGATWAPPLHGLQVVERN